jgi:hypothetical protein
MSVDRVIYLALNSENTMYGFCSGHILQVRKYVNMGDS